MSTQYVLSQLESQSRQKCVKDESYKKKEVFNKSKEFLLIGKYGCVCVGASVCARARARVCVCVCVCYLYLKL